MAQYIGRFSKEFDCAGIRARLEHTMQVWVTIATYFSHADALLARMRLESSGIECFLKDEHLNRVYSLASPALGGIQLQVMEEDVVQAREILGAHGLPFVVENPE